MKKILISVLGVIVVLIIGVIVAISFIDVNKYKDDVIQLVKDKTGREFEVGGEFEMAISLIPTVIVEDVKFGNVVWGSKPDMLHVQRFEVQVALLPLLRKNIHVNRFVLISPDILIETNKEGQGNWVFGEPSATEEAEIKTEEAALPGFNINEVDIKDAILTYNDGVTGETTQLAIEEFNVDTDSLSDPMDIVLKAVMIDRGVCDLGRHGDDGFVRSLCRRAGFCTSFPIA